MSAVIDESSGPAPIGAGCLHPCSQFSLLVIVAITISTRPSTTAHRSTDTNLGTIHFGNFVGIYLLLSAESGSGYVKDRKGLFQLLCNFVQEERSCPIQLLLFPKGWPAPLGTVEDETQNQANAADTSAANAQNQQNVMVLRRKMLQAKSNEFSK
jgi:hypothetical protein